MAAKRPLQAKEDAVTLFRELIGRGSGGEVFKARQWPSGRLVAIKRLAPEHRGDAGHLRRLRQEAAMVGGLDHENIVRLLRLDAPSGQAERVQLTMEYVDGRNLAELMSVGQLSVPAALHVVRSVLKALAHAHRAGIVHRDISPRNVLVSWNGQVKLSDFGLARPEGCAPTSNGDIRGTLPYASPEQLKGRDADSRSDLFAVGVLLYELLTGRRPWEGAPFEIIFALTVARVPLAPVSESCPRVAPELDEVVGRLLAYDADQRYQSAEDVFADIAEAADGQQDLRKAMTALRPPSRRSRLGHATWLAAVAIVGYFALESAGEGITQVQPPTAQRVQQQTVPDLDMKAEEPSPTNEPPKSVPVIGLGKAAASPRSRRDVRRKRPNARLTHRKRSVSTRSTVAPAPTTRPPEHRPRGGSLVIPLPMGGTIHPSPVEKP